MTDDLAEAIVRAALERAAAEAKSYDRSDAAIAILALASNPAEVAAIIKKAGETDNA